MGKPATLNDPEDRFSVSATAALPKTRTLKQENTFAIFDVKGDLYRVGNDELGIYHEGTRFLSRLVLSIAGRGEPLLLNSFIRKENDYLKVELTNPDLGGKPGSPAIPKSTLYVSRTKFLLDGGCREEISFLNYGSSAVEIPISVEFDADFRDLFEIRGMKREKRGERIANSVDGSEAILEYRGLDGILRTTRIRFGERPEFETDRRATFSLRLDPGHSRVFRFDFEFRIGEDPSEKPAPPTLEEITKIHRREKSEYVTVTSNSDDFNLWVERSWSDLVMMTSTTSTGDRYPYAGIPWYCTPFGRDGIWTTLLCLWANPKLAKSALRFLAKTQARESDPVTEAEPGKIFHEIRTGEMAGLKEIPFGKYYGTVDATPLYVVLAGEYFHRTGDLETIRELWPSLLLARKWIDEWGDLDGDGYVEYRNDSARGLSNQGWKDSVDSISHSDGSLPEGPIALCEVQGYVYSAKLHLSRLAEALGEVPTATTLRGEAGELRERFDRDFWVPKLKTYALALDGRKKPCRVLASNSGHLLYSGIVKPERARACATTLMSESLFSGWGIRTLGTDEKRYNPISYHNGSVWPHDSTIAAIGLSKYGFPNAVERIFQGLFRASVFMEHTRMPEVFCGFPRGSEPPTLYPVACAPQSWAAASVFGLLRALLGIEVDAMEKKIRCVRPRLPECIHELRIDGLGVGPDRIDLGIIRHREDVSIRLLDRRGDLTLAVEK